MKAETFLKNFLKDSLNNNEIGRLILILKSFAKREKLSFAVWLSNLFKEYEKYEKDKSLCLLLYFTMILERVDSARKKINQLMFETKEIAKKSGRSLTEYLKQTVFIMKNCLKLYPDKPFKAFEFLLASSTVMMKKGIKIGDKEKYKEFFSGLIEGKIDLRKELEQIKNEA